MHENRVKLLFVTEEEVLRTVLRPFPDVVSKIQHIELPKGYEILRIEYDFMRRGFNFLIFHPTFPEIRTGEPVPYTDLDQILKIYCVKTYEPRG